jgi:UDP-glucose 4-epimerase
MNYLVNGKDYIFHLAGQVCHIMSLTNPFPDIDINRDLLFVDDCVEALLMSAVCQSAAGEIFNVGVDKPTKIIELAETIVRVAGSGRWEFAPFTPERKAQEPGDFYSDISKIRCTVGWEPTTSLEEGLRKTIAYYRRHKAHYW